MENKPDWIETLHGLYELPDQVFYRWKVTRYAGKHFCVLSGVRFESLACVHGNLTFSSAAGYLHYAFGRPEVLFSDSDMVMAMDGPRIGCNFPSTYRKNSESVGATTNCGFYSVGPCDPTWRINKVTGLVTEPVKQTGKVEQLTWYRCTRQPENLKPLFSSELIDKIGGNKNSTLTDLERLFHDNIDLLGRFVEEGYIIPFDMIVSGGKVMCSIDEMSDCSSPVCSIDGADFRAEVSRLKWKLKTGEDNGDAADLGRLVESS